MKPIFYLAVFLSLFLFADCNKYEFVPDNEVPQWIKDRIAEDEAVIDSAPKLMQIYGAWIRYKYKKEYLFEYENALSSVMHEIYNFDGDGIDILNEPYDTFVDDRCCKRYVWKAPKYGEIF